MDTTWFSHSYLMSKEHHPFCDDCLVPQTVKHFLTECPSLLQLRNKYFAKINGSHRLDSILGKSANEENLFKFLEEAGFLNKI